LALIDDIKSELRVSGTDFDVEIQSLINAAKLEMESKGLDLTMIVDTDALIKQCIVLYCKANFGWDNPEAERFQSRYEMTLNHILLSGLYAVEVVV